MKKIEEFPKWVSRRTLSRYLALHEIFKLILNVKGSIIEGGVGAGGALMFWAQLSAIYEPYNYHREVIGFDTFEGFPSVSEADGEGELKVKGAVKFDSYQEILECARVLDTQRPISHIPKVRLIKGDFLVTGKQYLEDNPHTLVSLLFLDFDLYEPTSKALGLFLPRMFKGGVVVFDQIHNSLWPGETKALLEYRTPGASDNPELRQFPYEPNLAYMVL